MPRPRVRDLDLPEHMRRRGPTYFLRHPETRTWISLGRDLAAATVKQRELLAAPLDTSGLDREGEHKAGAIMIAQRLYASAKSNARSRGISWGLIPQQLIDLLARSEWKCAVTGLPFMVGERAGKRGMNPWIPSLDRIDPAKGYEPGNVRLVCCAVNFAMGDFGEDVLFKIASAMVERRRISMSSRSPASHKAAPIRAVPL